MALTKDQWFEKLKSWVPSWFFEKEEYNVAEFEGMALLFSEVQQQSENHADQTYLSEATDTVLDVHTNERSFRRLPQEIDEILSPRIRDLSSKADAASIKASVDKFLIVGESTVRQHYKDVIFASRESFYSRREVFTQIFYNVITILVDRQLHIPYSFMSREFFGSRENFYGSNDSSQSIFDLIAETINGTKAAGTLYRVIERR